MPQNQNMRELLVLLNVTALLDIEIDPNPSLQSRSKIQTVSTKKVFREKKNLSKFYSRAIIDCYATGAGEGE